MEPTHQSLTPKDKGKRDVSFLGRRTSDTDNGMTLLGQKILKKLRREIQTPTKRGNTRTNLM